MKTIADTMRERGESWALSGSPDYSAFHECLAELSSLKAQLANYKHWYTVDVLKLKKIKEILEEND